MALLKCIVAHIIILPWLLVSHTFGIVLVCVTVVIAIPLTASIVICRMIATRNNPEVAALTRLVNPICTFT